MGVIFNDPGTAPDVYASGLDHIELIGGGVARFVMFVNLTDGEGNAGRRVAARIVMPIAAMPDAIQKAVKVAGCEMAGCVLRHMPMRQH